MKPKKAIYALPFLFLLSSCSPDGHQGGGNNQSYIQPAVGEATSVVTGDGATVDGPQYIITDSQIGGDLLPTSVVEASFMIDVLDPEQMSSINRISSDMIFGAVDIVMDADEAVQTPSARFTYELPNSNRLVDVWVLYSKTQDGFTVGNTRAELYDDNPAVIVTIDPSSPFLDLVALHEAVHVIQFLKLYDAMFQSGYDNNQIMAQLLALQNNYDTLRMVEYIEGAAWYQTLWTLSVASGPLSWQEFRNRLTYTDPRTGSQRNLYDDFRDIYWDGASFLPYGTDLYNDEDYHELLLQYLSQFEQ